MPTSLMPILPQTGWGNYGPSRERSMARAFNEMYPEEIRVARAMCPFLRAHTGDVLNFAEDRSDMTNTAERFAVSLDVSAFKPEEIKVDLSGHELLVEGNQEEQRERYGSIQRSFRRKYLLPDDTNLESLRCCLSEGGCLNIECRKKSADRGAAQPKAITISRET